MLRAAFVFVCLAGVACGDETRVQLVLDPDAELNREAEVAAALARIQVVVDARDGLQVSGADGDAIDWDGDGDLEVILTSPPTEGVLPVLQIGVSSNAGRELDYRVLGYPAGAALYVETAVALGGVSSTCVRGDSCRVGVPFNLRPHARPPRVVSVAPPDGAAALPVNLARVTVEFSTNVENVADYVSLRSTLGHDPARHVVVRDVQVEGEHRSRVELNLDEDLREEPYVLTIDPGIVGENGLPFDQDPATGVEDGFVATYGAGVTGVCPTGFEDGPSGCEPTPTCLDTGCDARYVCGAPDCVEDCRIYDACPAPGEVCSAETGLCD